MRAPACKACEVVFGACGPAARVVRVEARCSPAGQDCRAVLIDITERKRVEDRVRVSEIRYRRLFEAAHDGVLLLDPGTRRITDANPFMTLLLGYPREQLVGKELPDIGLLKDRTVSQEMFRRLKREGEVRYEHLPLQHRDGRQQEVEVVANLYDEDGHPVIQCNIRDITARKRAEETQRRLEIMAASNRKLAREIARRQAVEESLRRNREHEHELLQQSRRMQEQLRRLSRQVLQAQGEERKEVSRELHDVIAQTLTGINLRLAALTKEAGGGTRGLERAIARTQRLVAKSVETVHQFARELRPAVLDDLGLIPALHAFLNTFAARTGIRTRLTVSRVVEQLDAARRTACFRVAQEALTNVARHAKASCVEVSARREPGGICLRVKDDGRAFAVERVMNGRAAGRLGLLGMRERLEMVGGRLSIESAPGIGTTVTARLPLRVRPRAPRRDRSGSMGGAWPE